MPDEQSGEKGAGLSKGQIAKRRMCIHIVVLLLAVGAVIAGGLCLLNGRHSGATAQLARLKGRWQRPDGGYVIDIREIDAGGQMAAAYFNPRPINVSQAQAAQEGATLKAFIELQDRNYPGATYNLTYDPENDQLRGVYFQPALQQSFDVVFYRIK